MMYVLNFYSRKSEERLVEIELKGILDDDVLRIFGFALEGNCAEVSSEQLPLLEAYMGETPYQADSDVSICEVDDR